MAKTFTGLKLQGELGRFGKTEYSDILGIYPMPDEKVRMSFCVILQCRSWVKYSLAN